MTAIRLTDHHPPRASLMAEVLEGFSLPQKSLSPKWFYDETGSKLFEAITELPEYYPTRTEITILRDNIDAMAEAIGSEAAMIEFGSGSSLKVRILLDHLDRPAAYVPVDISREHLSQSACELAVDYPDVAILPVCADFTRPFPAPEFEASPARKLVFFPGSTIGNFDPADARELLRVMAGVVGEGGGVLIGVDLKKDKQMLERAYNDAAGVTARFNSNLLVRINRELKADFDLAQFTHRAVYNEDQGRIEMHLISLSAQQVRINGCRVRFARDEYILTECSYKYDAEDFARMAREVGLAVRHLWQDDAGLFCVYYLELDTRAEAGVSIS